MAKVRFKMGTPSEVRRTLLRVSNMVANGEIDTKKANAIIYAANSVLASIRSDEQQKKIDELERVLQEIKGKR